MKCLIQAIGVLTVCEDSECSKSCVRWHSDPNNDLHDPILEVWNRQWLTSTYSMIAPAEADLYTVTLRLPAAMENILQSLSGHKGIYIEPKGLDGRSVSPNHQVIWIPKVTVSQARMYCQTVPEVLGLARLGAKFGLRCKQKDSQTVHAEVKAHTRTQFLHQATRRSILWGQCHGESSKHHWLEPLRILDGITSPGWRKGLLLKGTPTIPNHWAPNHQFTTVFGPTL